MCLRTVNIDEARLRRINPSFSDMKAIDRWLEVVINDAISKLEVKHRMAGLEVKADPMNEEEALADEIYNEPPTEAVYDAIEERVKKRQAAVGTDAYTYAIDVETMRERLHRMVHEVYSMP